MQIEAACNCRTDLNMKCCTKSRNGKSIKIQEPEKNEMLYFIFFFCFYCASILFTEFDAYENGAKNNDDAWFFILIFLSIFFLLS